MKTTFDDLLARYGPAEALVQADILGIPVPTEDDIVFEPPFELPGDDPAVPDPPPVVGAPEAVCAPKAQPPAGTITVELTEGSIRMKYLWASGSVGAPPRAGIVVLKIKEDDLVFSPNAGSLVRVRQKPAGKPDCEATVECLARISESDTVDMLVLRVITSGMEKTGNVVIGSPSVASGRPSDRVESGEPLAPGDHASGPGDRLSGEESAALWKAARQQASDVPGLNLNLKR